MELHDIDAKVVRLQEMLGDRLGLTSGDLARRTQRAGRHLPVTVRAGLTRIAAAQEMARHPKLAARLDLNAFERDYRLAMVTLAAMDPADRRRNFWLGLIGGMVFNLLIFAGLVLWVLRLRGFV